ncbi:MAG: dienelactone hydrolase family protein [Candidatus Parvarchaeum sp.]
MEIERTEIRYKTDGDEIKAYFAEPKAKGSYPGIVLIHEIFGVDDHIKAVSDRLAAEGYVVIAPDLFSSSRFSSILTPSGISSTMKFMMSIPVDKQRDEKYREEQLFKLSESERTAILGVYNTLFVNRPIDTFTQYLSSAVDFLKTHEKVNGRIGSVGFCFGGGMSINLGCTGKVDAVVIFYGENPEPIEKVKNIKNAVLGLYGGEDNRITSKVPELVKALIDYKKSFTIKVYPGAYHAFFNDTRKQTYNDAAAKDAWNMLLSFYKDILK